MLVHTEDSHMTDSNKIRRITKLGIRDFKSADEVQRRQDDLLERLKPNMWFRNKSKTLARCTTGYCAGAKCVEVCAFADWRRRLLEIPAAYKLMKKTDGPAYEVRVVRGIWARPIGDLHDVSIAAAKQLNRRALDTVYIPELVAFGTFKVSLAPEHLEPHWICEIHEIVAEAERSDLEKAFFIGGTREKYDSSLGITKVENMAQAISDVLRADLKGWQHPLWPDGSPAKPKKAHRERVLPMAAQLEFRRANDPLRLRPLFQSPQQEAEDDMAENSKAATLPRLVDPAHFRKPGTAAERLSQRSIATSCLSHDVQSIWASVWR